jgi:hypothetical protein
MRSVLQIRALKSSLPCFSARKLPLDEPREGVGFGVRLSPGRKYGL